LIAEGGSLLVSEVTPADVELTHAYGRWCERKSQPGDCLRLLEEGPTLGEDGRYALALALALDSVWDETAEALEAMVDPVAVRASIVSAMTMYLMLWVLPEPVSKGIAATLTAALIAYLGVDTVWGLLGGWAQLVEEANRATTFDELREAGERYGAVLGKNAARAFVMLTTAAIGNTVGLAAKAPGLPGFGQAVAVAETQAGVRILAVSQVRSVAMSAEGFTFTLAPGAVAMVARGGSGSFAAQVNPAGYRAFKSMRDFKKAMGPAGENKNWHHIVEQTPGNVERFGPQALHNTENVMAIDARVHRDISAFYSSRQEITGGRVVREWLRGQSYEQQRAFGLMILKRFGATP
jgi:hypothetical protein